MRDSVLFALASAALLATTACAPLDRVDLHARTGGNAALFGQFQAFDARSGKRISFGDLVRRCRSADVVFFGERHSDAVCNQLEAQLLHALAGRKRPVALAMEFFEADTQATLDAYLTGRLDEPSFQELARQKRAYWLAHRPLIELCRAAHIPVIAANAPRRLVRGYRKSGLEYDAFRAGLEPREQRWLPTTSEWLEGPYHDRFVEIMRSHPPATQPASAPATQPTTTPTSQSLVTQPASAPSGRGFRSQLLWDDSMAESVSRFRTTFPNRRVMLVVGSFHVSNEGGTLIKFRQRRPRDRVLTIVYAAQSDGAFELTPEDREAADVVIRGISPPRPRPRSQPTTAPTSAATPASAPSTAPSTQTRPAAGG
jgi:uncharacterized iron-regulated protein